MILIYIILGFVLWVIVGSIVFSIAEKYEGSLGEADWSFRGYTILLWPVLLLLFLISSLQSGIGRLIRSGR